MTQRINRRRFVQSTAALGAGYWIAGSSRPVYSRLANERLRFACIGVDGKGSSDSGDAANHGDIVAICDIDEQRLDKAAKRFPMAKKYVDFRKLLEEMKDGIDAVTVSTPDHTHAPAALMAMRFGKHVYCQKPMTHSIYEARLMGQVAKDQKVVTQMGNQGTAESGLRKAAAIVQNGALGTVNEVHVWTNRPIWPQGGPRPKEMPVPANVHWDLFLGPAAERPYAKVYHPFSWRGWWAFGTGALGDMACHTVNLPFAALTLRDPVSVQAETSGHNKESYPKWSIIRFEFPPTDKRPGVAMTWYDGGKRPDAALLDGEKLAESGSLIIGERGKLYSPGDYGADFKLLGGIEEPKVEFVQSPGHFTEWVEAMRGNGTPMSNFIDYGGPLTETILLGNLAVWADGKKIEWDPKALVATNAPEVAEVVKPTYRAGWTLDA